jgi:hypothetical protein
VLTREQSGAIAAFPLRVGARWTYRFAYRANYRWRTESITAEVKTAWLDSNGVLVWDIETAVSLLSPSRGTLQRIAPWVMPWAKSGYGVFTRGAKVIAYDRGTFYESDNREGVRFSDGKAPAIERLPALAWWPLLRLPLEPSGPWFLGESWTGDPPTEYAGYSMIGRQNVTVAAGSFEDCAVLRLPIGAGATEWRWFCEGLGFVRQEGYGNNPAYDQLKVELVAFHAGR